MADVQNDTRSRSRWMPRWFKRLVSLFGRGPVLSVALMASGARVAVSLGSFAVNRPSLIPDEQQYLTLASWVASGRDAEAWAPGFGSSLYRSTGAFLVPLRFLFGVFGDTRLAGQLLAATFGVLAAVLTVVIARYVLPPLWALAAGLVVAWLPSQVVFSSVVLRESMVWAALLGVGVAFVLWSRASWRWTVAGGVVLGVSLLLLGFLRDQTLLVAAWAALVAALVTPRRGRLGRVAVAAALAVVIPIVGGAGPGGWHLVEAAFPQLGTIRTNGSMEADTAIGTATTIKRPGPGPGPGPRTTEPGPATAAPATTVPGPATAVPATTVPATRTTVPGYSGEIYVVDESAGASLSALPRGLAATVLRPFPWETSSSKPEYLLAKLENLVWYVLYVLAAIGVVSWWRRRDLLAYPVVLTIGLFLMSAVTQGNLGTAFRHRDQVLWAVALLAAVGGHHLLDRRALRRTAV